MSEFNTGKCGNCPQVIHILAAAEQLQATITEQAEHAMDGPPQEDLIDLFDQLSENKPEDAVIVDCGGTIINSPEDIARGIRRRAAMMLDEGDKINDAAAKDIENITTGCGSPLTMRAKRAGQTVMVTVCMSPMAPQGEGVEPVQIRRS